MNAISVSKVVLNIKGKAVELTPEEAIQLRNELEGLFGTRYQHPVTIIQQPPYIPAPQPMYPACPIWYYDNTWGPNYQTGPTCGDSGIRLIGITN